MTKPLVVFVGKRARCIPADDPRALTSLFPMHRARPATRLLAASRPAARRPSALCAHSRRPIFNLFNRLTGRTPPQKPARPAPVLAQDDLFHAFSASPFPAIRARGEAIQSMAPCPTCTAEKAPQKTVAFECPECGWPTHCSEEHWRADTEHEKYCSRLREVNEDEHDLRSGRRIREFELPGELQPPS
jgi:splicing suppressor protein 51